MKTLKTMKTRARMKSAVCIVIVLALAPVCHGAPLSEELTHLESLAPDETALVAAVRRFYTQQKALVEWDGEMARKYTEEAKPDLVAAKGDDIEHRLALIEEAWRFVLQHYERNARANNYFGEFLYDYKGQQNAAERLWRFALLDDEDLGSAHNNLGLHLMHTGRYTEGLRHLGRALKLEPKNPDYLYNAAQTYLIYFTQIEKRFKMTRKKIYKEAMRFSRKATKYAPDDFEILKDYATNFYAAENFGIEADWTAASEAWAQARTCAETLQNRFFTLLNEGRTWIRAKRWAKAAERLEQALELRPGSTVTQRLLEEARSNAR